MCTIATAGPRTSFIKATLIRSNLLGTRYNDAIVGAMSGKTIRFRHAGHRFNITRNLVGGEIVLNVSRVLGQVPSRLVSDKFVLENDATTLAAKFCRH